MRKNAKDICKPVACFGDVIQGAYFDQIKVEEF